MTRDARNELADELRALASYLRDDADKPYSADVAERAAKALSTETNDGGE